MLSTLPSRQQADVRLTCGLVRLQSKGFSDPRPVTSCVWLQFAVGTRTLDDEVAENLLRPFLLQDEAHLAGENEQLGLLLALQRPLALLEPVQQSVLRVELLFSSQRCFVSQTRQRQSWARAHRRSWECCLRLRQLGKSSWPHPTSVLFIEQSEERRPRWRSHLSPGCVRTLLLDLPALVLHCLLPLEAVVLGSGEGSCDALRFVSPSVAPFSAVRSRKQPSSWPPA